MLLLTGNKPSQDIMKEKSLVLYEKLLRIEDPYWREYIIKPRQTQNGFIQKVLDIRKDPGAGVFSHFFSFNAPAGFIGTAFDGEEVAIRIALKQLLANHHKFENAVLLSDSQAAIQSISSFELPLTPEISHCQELLSTLTVKGKRIVLQWVPGHCGLWGNEQADFLGKRGANLLQHPNTATSYWKIKLFLKNLCTSNSLRDLQTRTALKSWRRVSPSSIADKPRHDAVAAFRLTTGHDCLAAHLHLLGICQTFLSTMRFWRSNEKGPLSPMWCSSRTY
ncbi:hypothetical protein AVEN_269420-1 [Araneus ventricosus]|uniref:RNase H type-1 domain-containing protein n=1 Tax=Araneus ventricosus TaxID=182803 RepID=A0A4Y2R0L4_ARAVE|nr:hypothetical protein AVEN_269420-1 [Araneus ventricosus]